jgi:hypothetical protein
MVKLISAVAAMQSQIVHVDSSSGRCDRSPIRARHYAAIVVR